MIVNYNLSHYFKISITQKLQAIMMYILVKWLLSKEKN